MPVYTTDDDGFRDVAERITETRNEELLTDLGNALDSNAPVLYVDSPGAVDADTLLAFQRRLLDAGPEDGGFGVVTGYTPELALDFYHREANDRGEHVAMMMQSPDGPVLDDATAFFGNDVTASNLAEVGERGLCSLALQTSGRAIHLNLSKGYLCGFPNSQRVEGYDGPQPYCVEDGEKQCPLDGTLVAAEDLDVSHVFLVSCASTIPNSTYGLPVHVGTGLLNGSASLLGSYRTGPSLPHEPILHYSLLRAGYDLAERCYLLNQNAHVNAITTHPYVPFGEPTTRLDTVKPEVRTVPVEFEDAPTVTLENVDGYVVDIHIPREGCPADSERLYLRNLTDGLEDEPLFYLSFEEEDGFRVLVYGGRKLSFDRLVLGVTDARIESERREVASACLENVERATELGALPDDAVDDADALRRGVRKLPNRTNAERFRLDAHLDAVDEVDEVFDAVSAIRDELISDLEDGVHLHHRYASHADDDDVYPADIRCHRCDRPVFVKQIAASPGGPKRAIGTCPRCSHVFDVPTKGRGASLTRPVVSLDIDADRTHLPVTVTFENPTDRRVHATFLPSILNVGVESDDGGRFFEPKIVQTEVSPGEVATAEFDLNVEPLTKDKYHVLVRVIGNLRMYQGEYKFAF